MKKVVIVILIIAILSVSSFLAWFLLIHMPKQQDDQSTPVIIPEEKPQISFVEQQMQDMTLRQKVSGMMLFHYVGTDQAAMSAFLDRYEPAGLLFMGDNTNISDEQLAQLTSNLQTNPDLPYLLAIDEEGGIVKRLASDTFPAATELKDLPIEATTDAFSQRTNLLKQLGFNLNFGIIADITSDPNSFIYSRVLGTTPESSSARVLAAVKATTKGTLSTIKHFPGHGETGADSHLAVPVISNVSKADWQTRVMPPFQTGVQAWVDAIMFGHLAYVDIDPLPASLSTTWHQIARDEMGFKGLIVTDSMSMLLSDPNYSNNLQNYIDAINAGNDLIITDTNVNTFDVDSLINGVISAVKNGSIPESRIDDSISRILNVRHSLK